MEGNESDGIGLLVVFIHVGDERDVLEKRGERVLGLELVVLGRDDPKLLDVLPAVLAVGVGHDVRLIVGTVDYRVEELRE